MQWFLTGVKVKEGKENVEDYKKKKKKKKKSRRSITHNKCRRI